MGINMTATDRKDSFPEQVRECECVDSVESGPERGVFTVNADGQRYFVYMHYSHNFEFWGVAQKKTKNLATDTPQLFHAFLGSRHSDFHLVPDSDFRSEKFTLPVQDKNGSRHWRLKKQYGEPPNGEQLSEYTELCQWFSAD